MPSKKSVSNYKNNNQWFWLTLGIVIGLFIATVVVVIAIK